jgi:hypothetical protein
LAETYATEKPMSRKVDITCKRRVKGGIPQLSPCRLDIHERRQGTTG